MLFIKKSQQATKQKKTQKKHTYKKQQQNIYLKIHGEAEIQQQQQQQQLQQLKSANGCKNTNKKAHPKRLHPTTIRSPAL